jgi:glycosyltransferase involved in cell wall biosynthesis
MHQYTADLANRMAEIKETFLCTVKGFPADRYSPYITIGTPGEIKSTGFSFDGLRIKQAKEIERWVLDKDPDVIHITGPHLWNIYLTRAFNRMGIPAIHTIHDLEPHSGMRNGKLLPYWNRQIIKSASHILVHGDVFRKQLIKEGLADHRVTSLPLLHLFLSFSAERKMRTEPVPSQISYENFILFFGRIKKYKGLGVLLRVFADLLLDDDNEISEGVKLAVAGSGRISDVWRDPVPENVIIYDGILGDKEAAELFSRCAFVVLPYSDASQSALIASAYFFRKPVLATRVGALAEYVVHGKTGKLVDPGNTELLRKEIVAMMAGKYALRTMGVAGRQWYDEKRLDEFHSLQGLYKQATTN